MGGKSFEELFRELYLPAYAVALKILRDRHAAEDATCEALARSLASWHRLQAVDHQRAYVLRATANVAIDMIRRQRTVPVGAVEVDEHTSFAVEDRLRLAEALRRLSGRQREVLVLRFMADMSETEVAESLRISPGSVKQHVHRGLSSLRGVLGLAEEEVNLAY